MEGRANKKKVNYHVVRLCPSPKLKLEGSKQNLNSFFLVRKLKPNTKAFRLFHIAVVMIVLGGLALPQVAYIICSAYYRVRNT